MYEKTHDPKEVSKIHSNGNFIRFLKLLLQGYRFVLYFLGTNYLLHISTRELPTRNTAVYNVCVINGSRYNANTTVGAV